MCATYLPHALSLITHIVDLGEQFRDLVLELVFDVSKYLWDRAQDTSALNKLGLQIAKQIHKQGNPRLLRMKHRVASEFRSEEAEELEMQVLRCRPEGYMAVHFVFSLYGLAEVWKKQGRLESAERLLQCLLKTLEPSSSKRAEAVIELADVFRLQKRFEEMESMLQTASSTVVLRRNYNILELKLKKCVACGLQDQGKTAEAETQFSELLTSQMALLGSDHLEVLETNAEIATLLKSQGHSEKAVRMLSECCSTTGNVIGPTHCLVQKRRLLLKQSSTDVRERRHSVKGDRR